MIERRARGADWPAWLAYAALSVYFTWPLVASGANLGVEDWDPILFHHAAVLKSVWEYGQLPFWNPWYCGGDPLWQNPQVPLVTATYLFALVMPLAVAMKVTILLHYFAGFAGMHVLQRRVLGLASLPAAIFFSTLFAASGAPSFHLAVGHATFLPYFYTPWVLICLVRAIETDRLVFTIGGAGLLALGWYIGGLYTALMTALCAGCFSLVAAAARRDWRPLVHVALMGLLSVAFAAPKLLPMAAFISDPRVVDIRNVPVAQWLSLRLIDHMFLDPYQYRRMMFGGQVYGWHEYGNYIGSFAALIIAASVLWIAGSRPFRRERWLGLSLAATAALMFALLWGQAGRFAPYTLLSHLPLMQNFHVPSRYTLMFVAFAAPMSAWAFADAARHHDLPGDLRTLGACVLLLAAVSLAYRNRIYLEPAFPLPPLETPFRFMARPGPPSLDTATNGFSGSSPMLRNLAANRDTVVCNEPLNLPGTLAPDKPVVFADPPAAVSDLAYTPNRIRVGIVATAPARLFLNQRYVNGWTSSAGPLAIDPQSGLAYAAVPAGTSGRIELRFRPPRLATGFALLAAGLLASAALWRRTLARGPASSGRPRGARQSSAPVTPS